MTTYPCDWVDAFTDRAFTGNGCAVVHGADTLDLDTRLALVRETSLTECAYIVASDRADFGARYYLRHREIPMAGHPTVATVASLLHRGLVARGQDFTLEVGAGVMPIRVHGDGRIEMRQPAPVFGTAFAPEVIAPIVGLAAEDVVGTPRITSTGSPFCITLLRDRAALARARLDAQALADWRAGLGPQGNLIEPYLVTLTDEGTHARLLLPPPGPTEDPFTGSATGCAACWLWAEGYLPRPDYVATQGDEMGRPGRAWVRVLGPRDAIEGVSVAGHGHVLISGSLLL